LEAPGRSEVNDSGAHRDLVLLDHPADASGPRSITPRTAFARQTNSQTPDQLNGNIGGKRDTSCRCRGELVIAM
jgi:hypothetical protein